MYLSAFLSVLCVSAVEIPAYHLPNTNNARKYPEMQGPILFPAHEPITATNPLRTPAPSAPLRQKNQPCHRAITDCGSAPAK